MPKIPPPHLIPLVTSMDIDDRESPVTILIGMLIAAAGIGMFAYALLAEEPTHQSSAPDTVVSSPCAERVAR